MKKSICVLMTMLLLCGMVFGCTQETGEASNTPIGGEATASGNDENDVFTADNEIFTYTKIDPTKTQLIVSRTGNIGVESLCRAFEKENEDVQIIVIDITGGNKSIMPVVDWVKNGYAPDIVISGPSFFDSGKDSEYFESFSADPIIKNFEADALAQVATNSNIYRLPGPSSVVCMMYNKTLFAQYGWEIPTTFDEFVALCLQIREDTNGEVEPWNPNAKYTDELLTVLEAFVYEEVFGGVENRTWYNDFIEGNAKLEGHMEPYFEVIQTLVDNDLLKEEHFAYSATTRGNEFAEGKIAMINKDVYEADNETYDFGYMPFPTTMGEIGYVSGKISSCVSVPKKEHSAEKQDAIDRFIEYYSSVDGQDAFIDKTLMVSNVKDVQLNGTEDLNALLPAIDAGRMFKLIGFWREGYITNFDLHQSALDITTGVRTVQQCIADADVEPYVAVDDSQNERPIVIATALSDFTVLETSFYIADAYREKARADIGLISNNEAFRGNLMRIFEGDIVEPFLTVLKPRSFENDSSLVKLSMTGKQILDALNAPPGYNDADANCVYAFSGLKCEINPWNDLGGKYISVKLADGTDIDPDKLYTVAAWKGTIADEFITETVETFNGTFEDIMRGKMLADGTISPVNDGRITLIWN